MKFDNNFDVDCSIVQHNGGFTFENGQCVPKLSGATDVDGLGGWKLRRVYNCTALGPTGKQENSGNVFGVWKSGQGKVACVC